MYRELAAQPSLLESRCLVLMDRAGHTAAAARRTVRRKLQICVLGVRESARPKTNIEHEYPGMQNTYARNICIVYFSLCGNKPVLTPLLAAQICNHRGCSCKRDSPTKLNPH